MAATMYYATPPGWQPRAVLPVLHRVASLEQQPEPDPIPDPSDPYASFGMRWQAYLAGLVACTLLLLAAAATWSYLWQVPAIGAGLGWFACVHGLCDYCRAAAAEARRAVGR